LFGWKSYEDKCLHEYRYVTTVCFPEIDGEKQEEKEDEGSVLFSKNSSRIISITMCEIP
jgi:hypothetical protein